MNRKANSRILAPCAWMLIGILSTTSVKTRAQSQFRKGWVMYVATSQGMATNFKTAPDGYVGELDLKPMYTVLPGRLRIGASTGLNYTGNVVNAMIGPLIAYKLINLSAAEFKTLGNIQLQLDARWSGSGHRLIGGGPYMELARTLNLGVSAYRDYGANAWWFQIGIGVNLIPTKFSDTHMPQ